MKNIIIKTIYFALFRPTEFYRKLKRKVVKKLIKLDNKSLSKILPWEKGTHIKTINGVKVKFDFNFSNSEKIYCYGFPNLKLTNVMNEFLVEGDTYIDIGANIGYFSALALGHVGKSGKVYAFEPVNIYYEKMLLLKKMNPDYNFIPINKALGEQKKTTEITITSDVVGKSSIGMNTLIPELRDDNYVKTKEKIEIDVFDELFNSSSFKKIKLIKIDVEGYEYFVLKGMKNFIKETTDEILIFCELTPKAYSSIGHSLKDVYLFMKAHGFEVIDGNSYEKIENENISTIDVVFSNSKKMLSKYDRLKYLYWNH